MTNEEFQKLQQFTPVSTASFTGKVYQCDYEAGKVQITVETPLRRKGQRSRVRYENVKIHYQQAAREEYERRFPATA